MSIKEKQDRLPTLHWLPKLHKRPYKARFIANSSSCTTTVLSKLLTVCLTAIKIIGLDTMIPFIIDIINRTFIRENTQYLACNEECAFFTSDVYNNHNLWSCQKVCDALVYLLDNIFIRFGTKLYRQTIGIPMGTNCLL